jgi:hypothetical protein
MESKCALKWWGSVVAKGKKINEKINKHQKDP